MKPLAIAPRLGASPLARASGLGSLFERLYVALALFVLSGAVLPLLHNPNGEGAVTVGDDALTKAILLLVYGVGFALASLRWREILAALRANSLLWALTLAPFASVLWSTDRSVSMRASVWILSATVLGVYVAVRFSLSEQLKLLGWSLVLSGLLSVVFVFALPDLGVDSTVHQGAWRGVFIHKNTFGRSMALTVVVSLMLTGIDRLLAPILWIACVAAVAMLVLSGSGTAIGLAVGLAALVPLVRVIRVRAIPRILVGAAAALLLIGPILLVYFYWEVLLGAIGRDATLTGRTLLWALAGQMILAKPWVGYGAQAFWHGSTAAYLPIWEATGWAMPHAHNGFLDLLLDLGLVGLLLFIAAFAVAVGRSIRLVRSLASHNKKVVGASWPLVYLAFFFAANLTESTILRPHNMFWVLFVTAVVSSRLPTGYSTSEKETRLRQQKPPHDASAATVARIVPSSC